MKKTILLSISALALIYFSSCKKDSPDPTPTTTSGGGGSVADPSLDKDLLTNPNTEWQNQSGSTTLVFNADGSLKSGGTWKWLNNSDSMEIRRFSTSNPIIWKFAYCQGDSMAAKIGSTTGLVRFKNFDW